MWNWDLNSNNAILCIPVAKQLLAYGLIPSKLVAAVTAAHVIILPHAQFSHRDNRRTDMADTVLVCHKLVLPAHNIPGVSNTQPANSVYMALSAILFQLQNMAWLSACWRV